MSLYLVVHLLCSVFNLLLKLRYKFKLKLCIYIISDQAPLMDHYGGHLATVSSLTHNIVLVVVHVLFK